MATHMEGIVAGTERRLAGEVRTMQRGNTRRRLGTGLALGALLVLSACAGIADRLPRDPASCVCYQDAYNGHGTPLLLGHGWRL